ncbi:MAG: hypothetical protein J6K17_14725 [Oscillospiraceae bacterium]|nr:hypothetical protein [Oscillospiraceae bacterium]
MNGIGTSGVLTGTMSFKTYYKAISGNAFPWCSVVKLICNDETITVPEFYVRNRTVEEDITLWDCSDKMGKTDEPVEFSDAYFIDEKISSENVLSLCALTCQFDSYAFAGNGTDILSKIGNISQSLVVGKTVREILDMYATAMCGYWVCDAKNKLIFTPFGTAYYGTTLNCHAQIIEGGTRTYTKVIMYNGDEIYTSGEGNARETLMISTPLASQELCSAVCASICNVTYTSWSCENGLSSYYFYPGDIFFSDAEVRFCTSVTLYPSAVGIFFSAEATNVSEDEYAYVNQVNRQLKRKLELDVRNGNMAITKKGIKIFANKNESDISEESTTVISVFKSEE